MKVIVVAALGIIIGIFGLVNGVMGGWIFVIIGALFLIAKGFQYINRAKKVSNNIPSKEGQNSKRPICSADDINSICNEKSGFNSKADDALVVEDKSIIEKSDNVEIIKTNASATATTLKENEADEAGESDTDRKSESSTYLNYTESKAVNSDTAVVNSNNFFGFHVSKEDIKRINSTKLGNIIVKEAAVDNDFRGTWLILKYSGNVNLVKAIETLIYMLQKHRKDIVIESVCINEIHDMYEPRIDEKFTLTEFQNAVKENRRLPRYGLGCSDDGYYISDLSSEWFPARVFFSVDDIKTTIYLEDERVSIYCDYDRTASQHKKLSADDIGAKLIFESIVETSV